jgi:hypothetical protein
VSDVAIILRFIPFWIFFLTYGFSLPKSGFPYVPPSGLRELQLIALSMLIW